MANLNVFSRILIGVTCLLPMTGSAQTTVSVTVDRGPDRGQCFGSLFEATTPDGSWVLGAGFQNGYNTRYRADRHAIQLFIRPTNAERALAVKDLGRPNRDLVGSYLYARDEQVHSTYGPSKVWNDGNRAWQDIPDSGGTNESMRIGTRMLSFGDSEVKFDGRTILKAPATGRYELFFYANGHLCFYHVHRPDGPYRPYQNDGDGFSKLYACPWGPDQSSVDLAAAKVLRLPIVGETTFAWGQLGSQIVTGSNIGGFYVFDKDRWTMLMEPNTGVSYQLYSSLAFGDKLLMGQYPTGRLFEYDGTEIRDLKGWPPVLDGVSGSAREAQTTVIYGGDLMVGVWPWGELWRYTPDAQQWFFVQRMFDHPPLSQEITHPYDEQNRNHVPINLWGQRVTSLVPIGTDLFIATSAKAPNRWDAKSFPFLMPDLWKSYGAVYRATMPGHLGGTTKWTEGKTTFDFVLDDTRVSIQQDGVTIAAARIPETLVAASKSMRPGADAPSSGLRSNHVQWGNGIYGRFAGPSITGTVTHQP